MLGQELRDLFSIQSNGEQFPLKFEYFQTTNRSGVLSLIYLSDHMVVKRKIEVPKQGDIKSWSITISSFLLPDIMKVPKSEKLEITFKENSGTVNIKGDKKFNLNLVPWKQEELAKALELLDEAHSTLVFNKAGWEHLYAASLVSDKKTKKIYRGVHLQYADKTVYIMAANDHAICYRIYQQPSMRGRPKKGDAPKGNLTIPADAIELLDKLGGVTDKDAVTISINAEHTKAVLEASKVSIGVDLIPGKFPTLEDLNPSDEPPIEVDKDKLEKAISALVGQDEGLPSPINVNLIFQNSHLTIHVDGKPDVNVPAKSQKPFQASVKVAAQSLLQILKYLTATQIHLMFPAVVSEKLVIEALGAMYLISGIVVEAVKYSAAKVEEIKSPAPQKEILATETQSDGSTVTTEKVEANPLGEEPAVDEKNARQELEKQTQKAKEVSQKVAKAAAKENDTERKELLKKGHQMLQELIEQSESGLLDDEKISLLVSSLFWANGRLYALSAKLTTIWRIKITVDPVED
jgi:DNA polymerase III sliding clamp (beta) subunit (PCNA family)